MDEHHVRAIAMSGELIKRTQATILSLAKTIEAMDSEAGLQRLLDSIRESTLGPPKDTRYVSAAIIGCLEYWIASGYFTRDQLIEVACTVANSIRPLPQGPTRRDASACPD